MTTNNCWMKEDMKVKIVPYVNEMDEYLKADDVKGGI